jgi:hypothetical protein
MWEDLWPVHLQLLLAGHCVGFLRSATPRKAGKLWSKGRCWERGGIIAKLVFTNTSAP